MKRVVILLSVIAFALALSSCKSKQKVVKISGADIEAVESVPEVVENNMEEEVTFESENTKDETFTLADGGNNQSEFFKKFHVVVGSFSIQANAQNLQKTLIKEGNKAMVVKNDAGMYRVIIASFDDYNQAKATTLKIQERYSDAWVLRQK